MKGSVTIHMNASVDEVWAIVSDVTRVGEFSPETFEAEWLDGATGPKTGAMFRGHVKRNGVGPTYWTTCKVVSCEPNRRFGFSVINGDRAINTWTYELASSNGGTDVTESFELAPTLALKIYWTLFGWTRGKTNRDGMRQTLERIKAVVERT